MAYGGRREGKGPRERSHAAVVRGTRDELSLLKVVPGRDAEERRGEDGRVDYLRLIWIVDYSGPRGAAWPRVSISEPLARAHLRLPLLLSACGALVLDPRYQTSLDRPPAPLSPCFLSLASLPPPPPTFVS